MKNIFQKPDQWVSVVECNNCKNQIPIEDTISTPLEYEYLGAKGTMYVATCKECHREHQLNELFKSEKQE